MLACRSFAVDLYLDYLWMVQRHSAVVKYYNTFQICSLIKFTGNARCRTPEVCLSFAAVILRTREINRRASFRMLPRQLIYFAIFQPESTIITLEAALF